MVIVTGGGEMKLMMVTNNTVQRMNQTRQRLHFRPLRGLLCICNHGLGSTHRWPQRASKGCRPAALLAGEMPATKSGRTHRDFDLVVRLFVDVEDTPLAAGLVAGYRQIREGACRGLDGNWLNLGGQIDSTWMARGSEVQIGHG